MLTTFRILPFCLMTAAPVQAAPWEDVIPTVAAQGASYLQDAEGLFAANFDRLFAAERGVVYRGTIADTLADRDLAPNIKQEHACGILGRMLGVPELITAEERIDVPDPVQPVTLDYILALWGAGKSYQAWAVQATRFAAQDVDAKAAFWNQDCAKPGGVENAPRFIPSNGPLQSRFPTQSYVPEDYVPAQIDPTGFSDWERDRILPDIARGVQQGANFAGRYSVVMHSCGGSCAYHSFTDVETGQQLDPPFGGERTAEQALDFSTDSTLLYIYHMQSSSTCILRAWNLEGDAFVLQSEEVFDRPADIGCRDGWNIQVIAR
ncbi:hypothetical protein [Yoonia sp. BS5-3]|uniref:Secreted protein n=1 Tax=Yoonia phaeophyticola TaxID=3137369 RepID=A0ABZ2V0J8_9RHOB